jgi:hypothetical protein
LISFLQENFNLQFYLGGTTFRITCLELVKQLYLRGTTFRNQFFETFLPDGFHLQKKSVCRVSRRESTSEYGGTAVFRHLGASA